MTTTKAQILVIDAHPVYIHKIEGFLRGLTYQNLNIAQTMEEGLSKAKELQPDIILLSGMYPDGESLKLLQELKQIIPSAKIIVQTGLFSTTAEIESFRSAGAFDVIMRREKDLGPLQNLLEVIATEKSLLPS